MAKKSNKNIKKTKLKSGKNVYRAEVYMGKNERPARGSFDTMKEAQEWRKYKLKQAAKNKSMNRSQKSDIDALYIDFAKKWLEADISITGSKNTYKTYERCLRLHVFPVLKDMSFRDIHSTIVEDIHSIMYRKELSSTTINTTLAIFSRSLEKARKKGYLKFNPIAKFDRYKSDKTDMHNYWSKEDRGAFLESTSSHYLYPMFYTALSTGMRKGELCGLRWDMVNLDSKTVTVCRTRTDVETKEKTKSGKMRVIPMGDSLVEKLKKVKKITSHEYCFSGKDGSPVAYESINDIFNREQAKAGVKKIVFHDLRHTFASHFMMNGGSLFILQKILGHSSITMTEHYSHLDPTHLAGASKFMSIN